ncbi:MAG: rod shape-determining protein MreC [Candidatus Nealsonbacteria bacterium]
MRFFFRRGKILVLFIVGIILVLSLNFFQKTVKGFFYTVSAPIQTVFWKVGDNVSNFFEAVGNLNNLQAENDKLRKTIRELLAEKAFLAEFKKENEILREALQVDLQKDFQLAFVEVIGKDIGQESILINQGAGDGLSVGMPVLTEQKILFGKITEVFESFARVTLISNKESSFDAKVSGTNVTGVAKGRGNSKIEFDLIPQDKVLETDDLVVSSPLGGIYPEGLLVGIVKKVSRNDVSPFYQAEILPLFDIYETSAVFIILNFIND